MNLDDSTDELRRLLTSTMAKTIYGLVVLSAGSIVVLWLLWKYAGPINTIIYVVAFVGMLALFPTLVALLGAELPGSGYASKLHRILGALAFGRTVLVDRGDRYEQWPAERDRVYVDGEWIPIEGGIGNWSMLGWRPFAITRYKDEETLVEARADAAAERLRSGNGFQFVEETAADGGTIERGGLRQESPPGISGVDGEWLLDLKRLFTPGLKRIGAIDVLETVEEVAQRQQAKSGLVGDYSGTITFLASLFMGVIVGYAFFAG